MKKQLFILILLSFSSFFSGCEIETSVSSTKIVEEIAGNYGVSSYEFYDGGASSKPINQVLSGDSKSNVIIKISKNTGFSEKNASIKIYSQSNGNQSLIESIDMSISRSKTKYRGTETLDGIVYTFYLENNKLDLLSTEGKIYLRYLANKS